jgi:hypothetical protein
VVQGGSKSADDVYFYRNRIANYYLVSNEGGVIGCRWCDIILGTRPPVKNKRDNTKEKFPEELLLMSY